PRGAAAARCEGGRMIVRSSSLSSSGGLKSTPRRASPARHDLELYPAIEDVEAVVGAAADDVLAEAHPLGGGLQCQHRLLRDELLLDRRRALERERVVHRRGPALARVPDDRPAAAGGDGAARDL